MMSEKVDTIEAAVRRSDAVLVEAAANGDADAFTELCRDYYPSMVAIAHSILGDRHLAEDAAQQTFAAAAVRLPQLREQNRFAGWLAAICRNAAKDMARKSRQPWPGEVPQSVPAAAGADRAHEAVRQALGGLSESAREVVFLRFYDGMSYSQISGVLGISEQAINGRLRRAKRDIAQYLRRRGFREARR